METNKVICDSFVDGYNRGKEDMLVNVCEWLDNINTDNYMDSGIFQMSDLIIDFKKAMEL